MSGKVGSLAAAFGAGLVATLLLAGCPGTTATPQSEVPSATPPPAAKPDSADTLEIVAAAERFANTTCQCSSATCADIAASDFVDWLRAHPERSGSALAAKRVLVAMEKMLFCRDKLANPVPPLDLDSPSSAPSDGLR